VVGTSIDAETTSLLIGTLTITMPADAQISLDNPITFTTSDLSSWMIDNMSFVTGNDLDALIGQTPGYGPPILTVVPEPQSMVALSGLAAMGALMWVVRRTRRLRTA